MIVLETLFLGITCWRFSGWLWLLWFSDGLSKEPYRCVGEGWMESIRQIANTCWVWGKGVVVTVVFFSTSAFQSEKSGRKIRKTVLLKSFMWKNSVPNSPGDDYMAVNSLEEVKLPLTGRECGMRNWLSVKLTCPPWFMMFESPSSSLYVGVSVDYKSEKEILERQSSLYWENQS